MSWYTCQLQCGLPGTPSHDAASAWLAANDIPINRTPSEAKFLITDKWIQIRLFDHLDGRRFISVDGGFAKREETFAVVARPEEFAVQLLHTANPDLDPSEVSA